MKDESIVQFVRFTACADHDRFETIWKECAAQFMDGVDEAILQRSTGRSAQDKHHYISQHTCSKANFRFEFVKGKDGYFPGHSANMIQLGGYLPVQLQCLHDENKDDVKIIAFITHPQKEFEFYYRQTFRHLNIYEAYFENCAYSYIMEFFAQEPEAIALVKQLRSNPGNMAAIYQECQLVYPERVAMQHLRVAL